MFVPPPKSLRFGRPRRLLGVADFGWLMSVAVRIRVIPLEKAINWPKTESGAVEAYFACKRLKIWITCPVGDSTKHEKVPLAARLPIQMDNRLYPIG